MKTAMIIGVVILGINLGVVFAGCLWALCPHCLNCQETYMPETSRSAIPDSYCSEECELEDLEKAA